MYAISVQHVPGSGSNDHMFGEYQALLERWQRPHGYASRSGAQRAYQRLDLQARQHSTFDGHIIVSICLRALDAR